MVHTILRHTPLSLLIISMLFSGILSVATAETGMTTGSTTPAGRATPKEMPSLDKEPRGGLSKEAGARVRTVATNMQSRLDRIIKQLEALADRIESRAQKLKSGGATVDTTLEALAQARTELRAASVIVNEELMTKVNAALADKEPRTAFAAVKEAVRKAHEHIKAAHKHLRDAVSALKAAPSATAENSATTTTNQ